MKLDKRKTNLMTIDTETCNMVDNNQLPYNLGIIVHDKYNNIYEKYNLIIKEIFYGYEDVMFNSNYYAEKLPKYQKAIANKEMQVVTMWQAKKLIANLVEKYNIKAIIAHNAKFDYIALNNLIRLVTLSKFRYFLPKGVEIWDSQYMARDTICKQKGYISWCNENGYVTKHKKPQPQQKAETLYKYISGNDDFIEDHIGLQDCEIEMQITCHCLAQHKKMRKRLWEPKLA